MYVYISIYIYIYISYLTSLNKHNPGKAITTIPVSATEIKTLEIYLKSCSFQLY